MKKPNLPKIARTIQLVIKKHSPEILTGAGIAGMITTTIMAVKATPKAILILNEEEVRRAKMVSDGPYTTEIGKKDVVRLTWKCYVPSAAVGSISIACLIFASTENAKRNAALATAYSLSESFLREYQEKVIETIGEKKEQAVRDAIAKDRIENDPVSNHTVIITNKGDTLCYDVISGRYFRIDIDKLKKIENELCRVMRNEGYISLNDFYYEIGLDGLPHGNDVGWNMDDGYMDLYFTSQLTPDETPCLVVNYRVSPKYNYYKHG